MARKQSRTPARLSPQTADDFEQIQGIGPVLAGRLRTAGIHTFEELASLSPARLAARLDGLSPRQIARRDWIGQARRLASRKKKPGQPRAAAPQRAIRQHYETFTFEFLLDEQNKTRRLRVIHVQSGDVDTWPTWDPERLVDFLARHTGERLPHARTAASVTPARKTPSPAPPHSSPERIVPLPAGAAREGAELSSFAPAASDESGASQAETGRHGPPSAELSAGPGEGLSLIEWHTLPGGKDQPSHSVRHSQPFQVRLTLALPAETRPGAAPQSVTACLYARKFGSREHREIGETRTLRRAASTMDLTIAGSIPLPGLYHLEALVSVEPALADSTSQDIPMAFFEGGILQVY